ncbi:MAG: hypothetical protein QGG87_03190 [Nitrospinota bacterium]|nr:hypothetical protein [Nitrospinota bacterium]
MSEVYFYIPPDKFKKHWPTSYESSWTDFDIGGGPNVWTYFTYITLNHFGFKCHLTTEIPDNGIVCSHSRFLPQERIVNDRALLICLRADYGRNHFAHMHVVQNPLQKRMVGRDIFERLFKPGPSYFIPYWHQPGLIHREHSRGKLFKNIVYMGQTKNLADELGSPEWIKEMKTEGINFMILTQRTQWHDYSFADAVCAVRKFSFNRHIRKPASKLVNAWLAGVPAILGSESAFCDLRRSDLDYLEVKTLKQTREAILMLRDNCELREKMIKNGKKRAKDFSMEAIAKLWISFFDKQAIPYHENWMKSSSSFKKRFYLMKNIRGLIKKL